MRPLKICLWIAAVGCLLSAPGMFLPLKTIESLFRVFGGGDFPDSPLLIYAFRLMSATYVGVGIFFVILARQPNNYPLLVPFSGVCSVLLGLVCAITGMTAKMPPLWFLSDALSCIVIGALILAFWKKAQQSSQPAGTP